MLSTLRRQEEVLLRLTMGRGSSGIRGEPVSSVTVLVKVTKKRIELAEYLRRQTNLRQERRIKPTSKYSKPIQLKRMTL